MRGYHEITGYDSITGGLIAGPSDAATLEQNYHPRVIDVQNVPARAARDLVIGLNFAAVPAGTQVQVAVLPQVVFRGERLVVPSDIAGSFTIDDIIIGNRSQLVAQGALPARAFQENVLNNNLSLDTASVSQQIILRVTNTSGGPLSFSAALFGTAAIP